MERSPLRASLGALVTENPGLKMVALGAAVLLWAWVQGDEVVEVRTRATVAYDWPEGLVRSRQVPKTLVVTVSGPQAVVRRLKRDTLAVQVDLSEAAQGTTSVDFTDLELAGLPVGVEVLQLSPPAVDVELDRALTKEVQVEPTLIGEPAPGYAIASVKVEPDSIRITGPQQKVRGIAQVSTDVLDIGGARDDKFIDAALAIADPVVDPAEGSPRRVRVSVDIEPVIVERTFEAVPVMLRGAPEWTSTVDKVRLTLRGPQEAVGGIRADRVAVVLTPPQDDASEARLDLSWSPDGADGVRVEHDGPADQVQVVRLEPRRFRLEHAP